MSSQVVSDVRHFARFRRVVASEGGDQRLGICHEVALSGCFEYIRGFDEIVEASDYFGYER